MFDDVVGAYGSRFLLAAGGVGIALILLIAVLWFLRGRAPSPFVRGGRNRQPRLQVLDAAAVDARRRLVLVRRDNVEHLVMIGGPTDIVIESRILPETEAETAAEFRPQPVEERAVAQERAAVQPRREPPPKPVVAPVAPPVAASAEPDFEPYSPAPAPVIVPVIAPPAEPVRQRPEPSVAPAVAPPMSAQQLPAQQMSSQQAPAPQVSAPPLTAERDGPQRMSQLQPRQPERPAPQPVPDAANAADILDAARQRVLPQQRIEPEVSTPPAQSIPAVSRGAPVATEDGGLQSAAIRRDFQRILDDEISANPAAERVVPVPNAQQARPAPQPGSPQPGSMPRRDPDMAPITGADAALQKEVARIFGEMSVNRDK
jgi:hypothetical protein